MTRTALAESSAAGRAPRGRRDRIVPDQHGAWAFLALPVALAVTRTGWFALLPAVALAWVAAYPVSWAATGRLTARRPERFDRALLAWSPIVLLAGIPVLVARPWLVWVLLVYGALWLVNLGFARSGGRAVIGSLSELDDLVAGTAGTQVVDSSRKRVPEPLLGR